MCAQYVGIDWSSGEWVSIAYTDGAEAPSVEVFEEIAGVWDHYGESARHIVVDVPIGLCESLESDACSCVEEDRELSRQCDDLARSVIGSQYRSVFTAPAREAAKLAAAGADHSDISDKNEELTGKRLTQQAAGIAEGIVEVDNLLQGDGDPEVLVEGHPEVCFRALSGTPLEHSKHTAVGTMRTDCQCKWYIETRCRSWNERKSQSNSFPSSIVIEGKCDKREYDPSEKVEPRRRFPLRLRPDTAHIEIPRDRYRDKEEKPHYYE